MSSQQEEAGGIGKRSGLSEEAFGQWSPVKAALGTISIVVGVALWTSAAEAAPNPNGLPTLLCKERQSSPGEGKTKIRALYSYRPHNCLIHVYHLSRPAFQLYGAIKWQHWNEISALGEGGIPGTEVDFKTGRESRFLSPVQIELRGPLTVCGHTVFTEITVRYLELRDQFSGHWLIDRFPLPGKSPDACSR